MTRDTEGDEIDWQRVKIKDGGAIFATFSDLEIASGSSVNDLNFVHMLKEWIDTEICYLDLRQSYDSLLLAYFRLLRKLLVTSRHRWVICRGVVVGFLGLLTLRKTVLFLGDAAFSSLETRTEALPARTRSRTLDFLIFFSLEKIVISRIHSIVVSNRAAKELLASQTNLHGKEVTIIPWSVGDDFFEVPPLRVHTVALKVGYAGNFMTHDLVIELIEAAQHAAKMGTQLELYLAGDGPLKERAREVAERAKGISIHFMGRIRHSEIPAFLRELDVFLAPMDRRILPSTLPIKVLEAAAAGRAVVTSDCGALRSVFKESMIYVEEPLIENTAKALSVLFQNPSLRVELGQRARMHATENFSRPIVRNAVRDFLAVTSPLMA